MDASKLNLGTHVTENDCGIQYLEHVQLILNFTYTKRKALQVTLESPSNTNSVMLMGRNYDTTFGDVIMFPTLSLHHWNESAVGEWKIKFSNNGQLGDKDGIHDF